MTGGQGRVLGLLAAIESRPSVTQRDLARELHVALGTANHLIRSLAEERLIEVSHRGRHSFYRLTPDGVREKLRLLRLQLDETLGQYVAIRDGIALRLEALSRGHTKVVFYGAGDIAQIAYIAAANNGMELVGLVDDKKAGQRFFGYTVDHPHELRGGRLDEKPYDIVILASYTRSAEMKRNLRRMKVDPSQVFSLFD